MRFLRFCCACSPSGSCWRWVQRIRINRSSASKNQSSVWFLIFWAGVRVRHLAAAERGPASLPPSRVAPGGSERGSCDASTFFASSACRGRPCLASSESGRGSAEAVVEAETRRSCGRRADCGYEESLAARAAQNRLASSLLARAHPTFEFACVRNSSRNRCALRQTRPGPAASPPTHRSIVHRLLPLDAWRRVVRRVVPPHRALAPDVRRQVVLLPPAPEPKIYLRASKRPLIQMTTSCLILPPRRPLLLLQLVRRDRIQMRPGDRRRRFMMEATHTHTRRRVPQRRTLNRTWVQMVLVLAPTRHWGGPCHSLLRPPI